MKIALQILGVVVAVLLTGAMFGTAGWSRPPVRSEQTGFRGTGMVQVQNPRTLAVKLEENVAPAPQDPVPPGGEPATQTYQNVKVLTDLSTDQFNRVMASITEWVAPSRAAPIATTSRTWPTTASTPRPWRARCSGWSGTSTPTGRTTSARPA